MKPSPQSPPPDDTIRAELRRFLERWRAAGPFLQEERWARLRAMTDEEARNAALDVLRLWQPELPGDNGDGLLRQRRVFARWRDPSTLG